jgi:hypothetical protein
MGVDDSFSCSIGCQYYLSNSNLIVDLTQINSVERGWAVMAIKLAKP